MKTFELNGTKRNAFGKKDAKAVRGNEQVPCVLYGGGEELHFTVNELEFSKLIYTAEVFTILLNVDGQQRKCILKDFQFHPVTDKPLHADFMEMHDDKPVTLKVPVRVTGNSVGVRAGGKLVTKVRRLSVRALPKQLPDSITVNVDALEIGKHIKVSDISLNGVQILDAPNAVITAVTATRQSVQAAQETAKK